MGRAPETDWHQVMINGVRFDAVTVENVLDHVTKSVQADAPGGLILTVNTDIMRQLPANPDVLEGSALVIADGMPLVWASQILGDPLPARVTGAELVPELSARAAEEGLKVFFFGAAPGVAHRASKQLREQDPRLQVVGSYSPELGFDKTEAGVTEAVRLVAEARPDVVFVALGFPRQERIALKMLEALPQAWFIGCGGALDMAAGDIPRAHDLWQKLGAEWLHRLLQEPSRMADRYLRHGVPYTIGLLGRSMASRLRNLA
ncbi:hypothetical protein GCM10009638_24670 [Luteococcus sanguinis]